MTEGRGSDFKGTELGILFHTYDTLIQNAIQTENNPVPMSTKTTAWDKAIEAKSQLVKRLMEIEDIDYGT